jgi:hypothetical protein
VLDAGIAETCVLSFIIYKAFSSFKKKVSKKGLVLVPRAGQLMACHRPNREFKGTLMNKKRNGGREDRRSKDRVDRVDGGESRPRPPDWPVLSQ